MKMVLVIRLSYLATCLVVRVCLLCVRPPVCPSVSICVACLFLSVCPYVVRLSLCFCAFLCWLCSLAYQIASASIFANLRIRTPGLRSIHPGETSTNIQLLEGPFRLSTHAGQHKSIRFREHPITKLPWNSWCPLHPQPTSRR